ncbi:alpha-2,8-sialyltransferase 8E-like [Rhinatrema bivittatum]|uniref:alpha-2,8-sialyltransferase 8E-like n=1 Tax=Rhinatrema bivittatum TaxID=194408 RepID=UPI00112748D8|nr:alpha-2,8-sialyltransferase 8E-like [Rhinatrema bivittatum]
MLLRQLLPGRTRPATGQIKSCSQVKDWQMSPVACRCHLSSQEGKRVSRMLFRSRICKLFPVILVACGLLGFYQHLPKTDNLCKLSLVEQPAINKEECLKLKRVIDSANISQKLVSGQLIKNIRELQKCPWLENPQIHHQYRSELLQCCNVSGQMVMSQENTYLGQVITYEVERKHKVTVNEELLAMLPESSPFPSKPYGTCAVVGNGGILLDSCCGSEIDKADFVIRCNLAPLNYSKDVGLKTNLVTANPSIIIDRFNTLNKQRRPFAEMMKVYQKSLVLMPPFSYTMNTDASYKVFYALQDFNAWQRVIFFRPEYLLNLNTYWKKKGITAGRLSTGIMLVTAALELCDQVTLYGFWPFSTDLQGKPVHQHYYNNQQPGTIHAMPQEFFFYTKMHSQGVLRLQVGKCA